MNSLSLLISPCPNDTFIFDAWINKRDKVFEKDTVSVNFFDIKTLNQLAQEGEADIIKLSVFTAAKVLTSYQLLLSGAALGFANGPLLISKRKIYPDEIPYVTIAVPGFSTTAYALLNIFFPHHLPCKEFFFYEIEEAILSNEVDAGLIIHENRFTYQKKGLQLIADLGKLWEEHYHLPLPLGIIAVKRSLPEFLKQKINFLIKQSVLYSLQHYPNQISDFVLTHAQIKDVQIVKQHIDMYVNNFSVELGEKGIKAVLTFFDEIRKLNLVDKEIIVDNIFIKDHDE